MTRIFADKSKLIIDLLNYREVAMLLEEITEKIIQAFYKVNNTLGQGLLEKVYENAMAVQLRKTGLMYHSKRKSTRRARSAVDKLSESHEN
jgi:hypothetical protein